MDSSDGSNRILSHPSLTPHFFLGSPSSYLRPAHTPEWSAHRDNRKNIRYGFLRMAGSGGWTARYIPRPCSCTRLSQERPWPGAPGFFYSAVPSPPRSLSVSGFPHGPPHKPGIPDIRCTHTNGFLPIWCNPHRRTPPDAVPSVCRNKGRQVVLIRYLFCLLSAQSFFCSSFYQSPLLFPISI